MKLKVRAQLERDDVASITYNGNTWWVDIDSVIPTPKGNEEIDAILTIDISLDKYVLMNPGIIYIDPEDVVKSLKVEHDSKIKEPKRKWSIYL